MGEQRGAGVKVGAKCLWDSDTDQLAQDVYISVSISTVVCQEALLMSIASRIRCIVVWQPMLSITTDSLRLQI